MTNCGGGNNIDTLVDTIIKSDTIFSRDIKSTIMVDENRKLMKLLMENKALTVMRSKWIILEFLCRSTG